MRNYIHYILPFILSIVALSICVPSKAAITLAALFSDHMVLQRQSKVPVWGWGSPGEKLVIQTSWQSKKMEAKADPSGYWKIELQTPEAGGPYHMKICGTNSIEVNDIWMGEVWLCSGQSNMTFPLKYSDSAQYEIAKADFPGIRYFGVQHQYGAAPFSDCRGSWQITTPATAGSFSAVAYYFAKKIQAQLKVPVGIVCSGWTGTPAEAWTPESVLQHDDALQFFIERWSQIPQHVGADSVRYHLAVAQWEKNRSASVKKPDEPRNYYYYSRPWCKPGALFNGMIHPLIPFCFKGVLWYQGESNVSESDKYEKLFTALIKSWRERWAKGRKQEQLPFYFVQIAPFCYGNPDAAARLRQAQYEVMKTVAHTAMVVTTDLGDMNNIHFTRKKEVGERLALAALARTYGFRKVVYKGPECIKASKINNSLLLKFDQPLFTLQGKEPQGFELGYKSSHSDSILFVPAKAEIQYDNVKVWNSDVQAPVMVRYAWLGAAEANLENASGLPAFPFQKSISSGKSEKNKHP